MKRLCLTLFVLAFATVSQAQIEDITGASVTIRNPHGQGSGTVINRKVGDDILSFVWTAAHVVEPLLHAGEFAHTQVVYETVYNGEKVSEFIYDAKVIRYSHADTGDDLAILQILEPNTGKQSQIEFYDGEIPELGTELYHVGSIFGQQCHASLSTGIIARIGRRLPLAGGPVLFDQTTVIAFPGCSGGGVFLRDGRYIGMLARSAGPGANFIVPIRRMRDFAKKANAEWALDASKPVDLVPVNIPNLLGIFKQFSPKQFSPKQFSTMYYGY